MQPTPGDVGRKFDRLLSRRSLPTPPPPPPSPPARTFRSRPPWRGRFEPRESAFPEVTAHVERLAPTRGILPARFDCSLSSGVLEINVKLQA